MAFTVANWARASTSANEPQITVTPGGGNAYVKVTSGFSGGSSGGNYGGGGSGAASYNNSASGAGGSGVGGLILVWEFS